MPDTVDWLLEPDLDNPGIRYFALADVLGMPYDHPDVVSARRAVMESGPVPTILSAQHPDGYWVQPGAGYYPKYRGTVWSMIYLAQLGANAEDPRIRTAGETLLTHAVSNTGTFTYSGSPAGNIACLAGNLGAALLDLCFGDDDRLHRALELMARFVTGEGVATAEDTKASPRYYRSGLCGPGFLCSANDRLPCAWAAVKVLEALSRVPAERRSAAIRSALQATAAFLFSVDPSTAEYPAGFSDKPSRSWFRFGFPIFYVTDVLQIADALTRAGFGGDPRLTATYDLVLSKRDRAGRWKMEYSYRGKTWADVEQSGKPSKWVTLRALRVLKGREARE